MDGGHHCWQMKIDGSMDGIWIGVATQGLTVDRDIRDQSQLEGAWWFRPSGEHRHRKSGSTRHDERSDSCKFGRGDTIQFTLDCDAGTLHCENLTRGSAGVSLKDVRGAVWPFVCFDYTSTCTLLETWGTTGGGKAERGAKRTAGWLEAAQAAWAQGMVDGDAIDLPPSVWDQAHDEQLARALGGMKRGAVLAEELRPGAASLMPYPLLSNAPLDALLRRAALLQRYSRLAIQVRALLSP